MHKMTDNQQEFKDLERKVTHINDEQAQVKINFDKSYMSPKNMQKVQQSIRD